MRLFITVLLVGLALNGCYYETVKIKKLSPSVIQVYPNPSEDMRYQFRDGYPYPIAY